MTPDPDEICVQRLAPGQSLKVRDAMGCTVMCCAGTVWITQENDARDIFLTPGRRFTFDRPGLAMICAVEGVKNEWLDDMGFAVVGLPASREFKITNRVRNTDEVSNRQVKDEWRGDREYTD
jgi:hypothetical protein